VRNRTKILVGVGLLAVAVGVVMVRRPAKPVMEVSFIRYTTDGEPVLNFTNRGQEPMRFSALGDWSFWDSASGKATSFLSVPVVVLAPLSGTQVVARLLPMSLPMSRSHVKGETVSAQCVPQPSPLRRRLEDVLSKVGINIASTGFVATATLPAH
jgi:hypothetical protein